MYIIYQPVRAKVGWCRMYSTSHMDNCNPDFWICVDHRFNQFYKLSSWKIIRLDKYMPECGRMMHSRHQTAQPHANAGMTLKTTAAELSPESSPKTETTRLEEPWDLEACSTCGQPRIPINWKNHEKSSQLALGFLKGIPKWSMMVYVWYVWHILLHDLAISSPNVVD